MLFLIILGLARETAENTSKR